MWRLTAIAVAVLSAAAMLYVGLYQSRAIKRLWCPLFAEGCERVADADFAKPYGVPDGYIAFGLYLLVILFLLGPVHALWIWGPLVGLSVLAVVANVLGLRDMARLGAYCLYCLLTALLSPLLLWAVVQARRY